jgi:hypothetical protein
VRWCEPPPDHGSIILKSTTSISHAWSTRNSINFTLQRSYIIQITCQSHTHHIHITHESHTNHIQITYLSHTNHTRVIYKWYNHIQIANSLMHLMEPLLDSEPLLLFNLNF